MRPGLVGQQKNTSIAQCYVKLHFKRKSAINKTATSTFVVTFFGTDWKMEQKSQQIDLVFTPAGKKGPSRISLFPHTHHSTSKGGHFRQNILLLCF